MFRKTLLLAALVVASASQAYAQCPGGVCPTPAAPRMPVVRSVMRHGVSVRPARSVAPRRGLFPLLRRLRG